MNSRTSQLKVPYHFIESNRDPLLSCGTDWPAEDQEVPPGEGGTTHMWEESWDDDDTSEDFSKQLKYVLVFQFGPEEIRD